MTKRTSIAEGPKNPIWTVTKFEIIRQLKKPSFWISLLLLPLLILGIVGLSALSSSQTEELVNSTKVISGKTVALTDEAGIIENAILTPENLEQTLGTEANFKTYASAKEGIAAVKNGDIDIFYHIPADFLETKSIKYYTRDKALLTNYEAPLRALLSGSAYLKTTPENALILTNGYQMSETTFDENGNEVNLLGEAIVPLAILAIFYVLICVFGNRLLMAVVEEKENRISEMILTAVSARNLIIGKIVALITLGFLQILVFIIPLICTLVIYRDNPMVTSLLGVVEWHPVAILMNVALLLLSYFFFAGACTFVGALTPTARDASQFISPVIIGMVIPLYFIQMFISGDNTPITYLLTYFPLSAPIALMLRNAFGTLPLWEFFIGLGELCLLSAATISLTVRTFQQNAINFSVVKLNFKPKKLWKS